MSASTAIELDFGYTSVNSALLVNHTVLTADLDEGPLIVVDQ